MTLTNEECEYLLDNLPRQLTAMLLKGIVHNLNGPLQVISMQTELIDKMASINQQQIDNLKVNITRLEKQVQYIANHSNSNTTQSQPIILNNLIEQELNFWNADLFFKHKVNKKINLFQNQVFTITKEAIAKGIIGSCIALSIEKMRHNTQSNFEINCSIEATNTNYVIEFKQDGLPFNDEQTIISSQKLFENIYPTSLIKKYLDIKTKELNWTLNLDAQVLAITIPLH